jgi:hypothetical protein
MMVLCAKNALNVLLIALAATPGALSARGGKHFDGEAHHHLATTGTGKEDVLTAEQESVLQEKDVLFVVLKSENENTVVYEATDGGKPVKAYWRDFKSGPEGPRAELDWMASSMAYGVQDKEGSAFSLAALPSIPITVAHEDDKVVAKASVGGKELTLHHFFVKLGWIGVSYVNVHGIDASGGTVCLKLDTSANVQGDC